MSVTDELLQNNESYAQGFDKGELGLPPAKGLVVIACMDARLIPQPLPTRIASPRPSPVSTGWMPPVNGSSTWPTSKMGPRTS